MSESHSQQSAVLDRPATDDDGLHHICAVHPYAEDADECERNVGCRSICGRPLSGPLTDEPLAGEQPCIVCFALEETIYE